MNMVFCFLYTVLTVCVNLTLDTKKSIIYHASKNFIEPGHSPYRPVQYLIKLLYISSRYIVEVYQIFEYVILIVMAVNIPKKLVFVVII
jgi:hypothetical protein